MDWDLPPKKKTDICTIMYTSEIIGDPKGVIIKNEALMAEVLSVDHILMLTDRVARTISLEASLVSCCIAYTIANTASRQHYKKKKIFRIIFRRKESFEFPTEFTHG